MSRTPESKKLVLDPAQPVHDAVVDTYARVLRYAQRMARVDGDDLQKPVHEYRKSIRRVRGLLRVVRPLLAAEVYDGLQATLREAVGLTSSIRDAHVMHATLQNLVPEELRGRRSFRQLDAYLGELEHAGPPPDEIRRVLTVGDELIGPTIDQLAAGLPDDTSWDGVATGIAQTYKRCRKGLKLTISDGEDEWIHYWRKRCKEVRYQLEWLSSADPDRLTEAHEQFVDLAQNLGEVTDLLVLKDYIRDHAPAASRRETELMERGLHDASRERLAPIVEQGNGVVAEKPEQFAARAVDGVVAKMTKSQG